MLSTFLFTLQLPPLNSIPEVQTVTADNKNDDGKLLDQSGKMLNAHAV
jgi:hypothetical protein